MPINLSDERRLAAHCPESASGSLQGASLPVELAMRYQKPSIEDAFRNCGGAKRRAAPVDLCSASPVELRNSGRA
jgi:hypothetical protein